MTVIVPESGFKTELSSSKHSASNLLEWARCSPLGQRLAKGAFWSLAAAYI